MMRRTLAAITAITATFVLSSGPAEAQERSCVYDHTIQGMRCRIVGRPGGPDRTVNYPGSPIGWRRNVASGGQAVGSCIRNEVVGGVPTEIIGVPWFVVLFNTDTGVTISITATCEFPGQTPPQPPPPPPTPDEFIEEARELLLVDFELSPRPEFAGITGVDTWFWCDTPATVSIPPLELRGWTVSAEMDALTYSWSVEGPGDGGSTTVDDCGVEPDVEGDGDGAAWIWQPQTLGEYNVDFVVTWFGGWTLEWNGTNTGTFPLGPVDVAADPTIYPVDEYVGVLVAE